MKTRSLKNARKRSPVLSVFVVLVVLCVTYAASQTRPKNAALEGLDPVLLTEGQETPGKDTLTVQKGRFWYQFAGEDTRARFNKDPERYSIQLDGACARMGPPVGGSPDAYFVYKNRIYIFGSQECYKRFSADPSKYLESEQPKPVFKPTPDSRAKGQALLSRSIEAMGGIEKWRSIRSFVETRRISRANGAASMILSARLPESWRTETIAGQFKFGSLITPSGAFGTFRDEGERLPESFRQALLSEWNRGLMALLLNREANGFEVSYSGRSGNVELLAVNNQGTLSTLQIDVQSGQVTEIAWRGRAVDGFGEFRVAYSDYRDVGGLRLPFRAQRVFEGRPVEDGVWTVESYRLNPQDIDSLLQPPTKIQGF